MIAVSHFSLLCAGDDIRFVFPAHLLPTRQLEQDGITKANLRMSISMEMHDRVVAIASETHPESLASSAFFVGGKASAEMLMVRKHHTTIIVYVMYIFLFYLSSSL